MAGDDLVLDLVVRGLGENAAADELVPGGVGAAVDDAPGVSVADTRDGLELIGGGGVGIERRCGGWWCGRRGVGGVREIEKGGKRGQEGVGKEIAAKSGQRRGSVGGGCHT